MVLTHERLNRTPMLMGQHKTCTSFWADPLFKATDWRLIINYKLKLFTYPISVAVAGNRHVRKCLNRIVCLDLVSECKQSTLFQIFFFKSTTTIWQAGAVWEKIKYQRVDNVYSVGAWIGSQWRVLRRGETWSLQALNRSLSAKLGFLKDSLKENNTAVSAISSYPKILLQSNWVWW